MASIDDDKPTTSQIEKLNGGNYRSWATTMRAILREKKLFDIVDSTAPMPAAPAEGAPAADVTKYRADKDAWEPKAMKACTILLSSIKGNLITYVEDEDNPATIWRILKTDSAQRLTLPSLKPSSIYSRCAWQRTVTWKPMYATLRRRNDVLRNIRFSSQTSFTAR